MDVPLLTLKEVNMPMNLVVIHALFCRHLWMAKSDPHVLDTGTAYLLLYNCASTKEVDLIEGDLTDFSIGAKETNVAVPTRSKITLKQAVSQTPCDCGATTLVSRT